MGEMERTEKMYKAITAKMQQLDIKIVTILKETRATKHESKQLREDLIRQEEWLEMIKREREKNNVIIEGAMDRENKERKIVTIVQSIELGLNGERGKNSKL